VQQGEAAGEAVTKNTDKPFGSAFAMNAISFFGMQLISAGNIGGQESNVNISKDNTSLRRLNIANDNLIGFVLINDILRAGIYTDLIRNKTKLSELEFDIRSKDIGLNAYNKEKRQNKIFAKED
jgi:NAD(P)H-nitrite reductase large subunit